MGGTPFLSRVQILSIPSLSHPLFPLLRLSFVFEAPAATAFAASRDKMCTREVKMSKGSSER